MRIVFFGTPLPAARILQSLANAGRKIICVVTQPDRKKGRGQKSAFPAVKEAALKNTLPIEQPETVKNNPAFIALVKSLKPDLGVVVAYGKILPKELIDIPKYGFINLHASLLPKYRGAAPIQWALLNGEKETGITLFKLVEALDAGPILAQKKVKIKEEDDAQSLSQKIFFEGEKLLIDALEKIEKGTVTYSPQNDADSTFAPTLTKESGELDWKKSAREIHDRIRALMACPTAHTFFKGKMLKLLRSKMHMVDLGKADAAAGTIVEVVKGDGFIVVTGAGHLQILEVQLEGGRRMGAYEFAIGHDLKRGETLPS